MTSRIPVVNAMSACSGFRPVAKAFGAGSTTIATFGMGNPLAMTTSCTKLNNFGLSSSVINFAPVIVSTKRSDP